MSKNKAKNGRFIGRGRYGNKPGLADWMALNERKTRVRKVDNIVKGLVF